MTFIALFSTPQSKEHRQKCGLWYSLPHFLSIYKVPAVYPRFCKETHLQLDPWQAVPPGAHLEFLQPVPL